MMKNKMMKLPAACSVMNEEEMMYVDGGFALNAQTIAAGVAVLAVGAMGLNMFSWFTGNRDTNFIQDSMNLGASFINGAVNAGQSFLNGLLGK